MKGEAHIMDIDGVLSSEELREIEKEAARKDRLYVHEEMRKKREGLRESAERKARAAESLEQQAQEKWNEVKMLEAQVQVLIDMATALGDGEAGGLRG